MKNITTKEFDQAVKSNTNVVIQFSAAWCGPCKTMTPILDEFATSREDVTAFKVDIGEETDLATKFNVRSIPTLIFFQNGEMTKQKVGLIQANQLNDFIV